MTTDSPNQWSHRRRQCIWLGLGEFKQNLCASNVRRTACHLAQFRPMLAHRTVARHRCRLQEPLGRISGRQLEQRPRAQLLKFLAHAERVDIQLKELATKVYGWQQSMVTQNAKAIQEAGDATQD